MDVFILETLSSITGTEGAAKTDAPYPIEKFSQKFEKSYAR